MVSHSSEPASRLIWIYAVVIGAFYGTAPAMPLLLMDRFGITERTVGYVIMYFGGMGVVVLGTLPLTGSMTEYLRPPQPASAPAQTPP